MFKDVISRRFIQLWLPWLWCISQGLKTTSWDYKNDKGVLTKMWETICPFMPPEDQVVQPRDDDEFDALVAYGLGVHWLKQSGEVCLLGSRSTGLFWFHPARSSAWRSHNSASGKLPNQAFGWKTGNSTRFFYILSPCSRAPLPGCTSYLISFQSHVFSRKDNFYPFWKQGQFIYDGSDRKPVPTLGPWVSGV